MKLKNDDEKQKYKPKLPSFKQNFETDLSRKSSNEWKLFENKLQAPTIIKNENYHSILSEVSRQDILE